MAIPPQEVSAERALVSWPESEGSLEPEPAADSFLATASLRIRELELTGFKSFRDRTVLRFGSGVSGIVGPNGCGKSNVVDAIRWVLGEQSAKRLRGEGMEDVIFGGNERQAPLGMAQVSIVFENDGLPLEQIALLKESGHPLASPGPSDIMVTRSYFRSGESEYQINGIPCRLRDITELFLGTGLGSKAYAIIEQGRVEQLVAAKPEELRLFIEEAAGTTLYRSRRQVAERKMERTNDNLLRVNDVLHEVERQLAMVRRQAKRASQYRALQEEVATLDLALSARQRATLAAVLADLERAGREAAEEEVMVGEALQKAEASRRSDREHESEAQRRLQVAQAAAFEARTACETCRHEIARYEGRARELTTQGTATERDLEATAAEIARGAAERTASEAACAELEAAIDRETGTLAERETALARATVAGSAAQRDLEAGKVALVDAMTEEARLRNLCTALAGRRYEESGRLDRLRGHAGEIGQRERAAQARVANSERELVRLQRDLERLGGYKKERADELRRGLAERDSWARVVAGMRENLTRESSRRDSLRELAESHAGYGEGVRAVLAATAREEALGLVAEVLDIPAQYERAVAAALGEHLQAVVTVDQGAAREAVQALRRAGAGRVTCIPQIPRVPAPAKPPRGARILLDLVEVRAGFERVAAALLGQVLLVEDLESALGLWEKGGAWLFVTPAGETVDTVGAIAGGVERAEETLLAARRELRALDVEVERRERDVATGRQREQELAATVAERESAVSALDAELAQVTIAVAGIEKDAEVARQEVHDLREQGRVVAVDLDDVESRRAGLDVDAGAAAAALVQAEGMRAAGQERVADAESSHLACQHEIEQLQERITQHRILLAEQRAQRQALADTLERLRQREADVQQRRERLEERRGSDAAALAQTGSELTATMSRLAELERDAATRATTAADAEREMTGARERAETAERAISALQSEVAALRARASDLEVQTTTHRLEIAHMDDTIRERYQRELAPEPPADESEVSDKVERLEHLRERLTHMGEVNVAALGEAAELEERQRFLDSQRADLERALEDLRKTIVRLNRASRARFRETFERVDGMFREVFPKLFKGGKAHLRLSDETQMLDSGVEIVAQPPGKRIGPLDSLSGGEKALTAVSLIFALFLIKPSPFCVLDEVDAPLDDANIGRFNGMVQEMSERSQFVLITHNKRTMEAANTLYGITMEEPGVSKVVSVRLPE